MTNTALQRNVRFVEALWAIEGVSFTDAVFFSTYQQQVEPEAESFDREVEFALASLYLQKLVRFNVLSCSRGEYQLVHKLNKGSACSPKLMSNSSAVSS